MVLKCTHDLCFEARKMYTPACIPQFYCKIRMQDNVSGYALDRNFILIIIVAFFFLQESKNTLAIICIIMMLTYVIGFALGLGKGIF